MTPWVKALGEKFRLSSSDLCNRRREPIPSSYSPTSIHAPWLTRQAHTHICMGTHTHMYGHTHTHVGTHIHT